MNSYHQKDLPDYHMMVLLKMRQDKEKGNNEKDITTKSFAVSDDYLPRSENFNYCLPNLIILLDQDIKSLCKE